MRSLMKLGTKFLEVKTLQQRNNEELMMEREQEVSNLERQVYGTMTPEQVAAELNQGWSWLETQERWIQGNLASAFEDRFQGQEV